MTRFQRCKIIHTWAHKYGDGRDSIPHKSLRVGPKWTRASNQQTTAPTIMGKFTSLYVLNHLTRFILAYDAGWKNFLHIKFAKDFPMMTNFIDKLTFRHRSSFTNNHHEVDVDGARLKLLDLLLLLLFQHRPVEENIQILYHYFQGCCGLYICLNEMGIWGH